MRSSGVFRLIRKSFSRGAKRSKRLRAAATPFQRLQLEQLEGRIVPAIDLVGYNFSSSSPSAYFHVEQSSISWGETITVDFAYANIGSTSSSQTFNIALYLTTNSTINPSTDYELAHLVNSGFVVPAGEASGQIHGSSWSYTIQLPASDPLSPLSTGAVTLGMDLDCDNAVTESNKSNNLNQGVGQDLARLTISPPVAVVTDSVAPSNDHKVDFGSVVDDGPGNAQATQTVTLSDSASGSLLKVLQNGISLANGTNFHVLSILSNDLSTPVSITNGYSLIKANNAETWTIELSFDPTQVGNLSDTLNIQTDDPSNPTISVALTGVGTPQSNLVVTNPASETENFGDVAVNGAETETITLANNGSGPLTINQNGISVGGAPFSITSITSSTQGAINLASGSATIAANSAEIWSVVIAFAPTAIGSFQAPLTISSSASQDGTTVVSTTVVSLVGSGMTPPQLSAAPSQINFGSISADGPGNQLVTQTLTLTNTGQLPLQIDQNGISLAAGTQFKIVSVVSSTQGTINLASGPGNIAPNSAETWTVTLEFDPSASGSQSDTLSIASNDPANPTTKVALSGVGLNQPILALSGVGSANSPSLSFPPTLDDGAGGRSSTLTFQITNFGTQALVVPINGLTLANGTNYHIASIVSSTQGAINLSAGSASIAPVGAESWTVSVVFDPTSVGTLADQLQIASNDPANPTVSVALSGQGVIPAVTAESPKQAIHVSADQAYTITWNGVYAPGTGTYSVYYDTDRDPTSGLVPIATNLPQSQTSYAWQVPATLVGQTITIYVTFQDGSVVNGSYAAGGLTVDAAGSDRLLSAAVTSNPGYLLTFDYLGATYAVAYTLSPGDNALYPVSGGIIHEYHVFLAASLTTSSSETYDALGNVTSTTDANGETTTYTYDQLSRVTQVNYPDGTSVQYTYDAASNLLTMHDSSGWEIYGYDVLDRLTSVTYSPTDNVNDPSAITIGYHYDADNNLTELDYPSGERILYGYDAAGKLTSVTDKVSGQPDQVTTYAYNPVTGLLKTETLPNNTTAIYSYDTNGNVVGVLYRQTSTQSLILQYQYTLDAAGRQTLAVMTTPSGSTAQAYVYDDMDRLIQVTYSNSSTISSTDDVVQYTYDGNGNRLTQTTYANGIAAGATQTLTYAYNTQNELLSVTDQNGVVQEAYAYDWRGNQIEKVTPTSTTLYTYNSQNLLTEVTDGTNVTLYGYDGAGRRVSQTVNGVTMRFVVDPASADYQTLEELAGSGATSASYTYGINRISGVLPGQTGATFYLSDIRGSVGGLVNNSGASLGNYVYDAFGNTLTSIASATNPFQYNGEFIDSVTGLTYLRARNYDPTTGRFLQEDPLGIQSGTNEYVYTRNNPINDVDPTGLSSSYIGIVGNLSADPKAPKTGALPVGGAAQGSGGFAIDINQALQSYNSAAANAPFYELPSIAINSVYSATNGFVGVAAGASVNQGLLTKPVAASVSGQAFYYNGDFESPTEAVNLTIPLVQFRGIPIPNSFTLYLSPNTLSVSGGAIGYGTGGFSASDTVGEFKDIVGSPTTSSSSTTNPVGDFEPSTQSFASSVDPGGVLIDQAATLVNQNINDIQGATYDPSTNQLVFLGTNSDSTLSNVNLDLFTTAIQAVYGSSGPPFVTLDPSAKLVQQSFNIGSGDGVIPAGQSANIPISYTPYTATNADDMTLTFDVNGVPASARILAQVQDGTAPGNNTIIGGGRYAVMLALGSVTGLPSGVTFTSAVTGITLTGNTITGGTVTMDFGQGYTLTVNAQGQQSNFYFTLTNSTGTAITITNLKLVTDLQQRKFGGPIDNTYLGWIMEEADRVMKELAGGKDQLTGATYNSQTPGLAQLGFENVLERYVANNQSGTFGDRFWFTPDQETLERYVDPTTGEATVVFSQSSVELNTEALILGQPEDPTALSFANWFNTNYGALEQIEFPVHDPNDPTGNNFINVKIFGLLQQAMQAVSLARFFHDNNIPLNTWWINSYTPPVAYTLDTIPTLTNTLQNGSVTVSFYGGVTIKTPNTYVPDVVAQAIANDVLSQRTAGSGDVAGQAWSVSNTPINNLNAVAVSLDDQQQTGNIALGATDLSFSSPGGEQLSFQRYYNSSFLGDGTLGLGWQPNQYQMQFQNPSMEDYAGLMRDSSGKQVPIFGADSDTYLRTGEIRIMDQSTGTFLNFFSSLTTQYALDGEGNPILSTSGLTSKDVPTFTPGMYTDGSTLTQDSSTHDYTLTHPDGSTLVFDPQGNLLSSTDNKGYAITYTYTGGKLTKISDSASQVLTITYGSNGLIQYVAGPDSSATPQRRIAFNYDSSNRLIDVDTQALQSNGSYSTTHSSKYDYNSSNQISAVIGPNGLTTETDSPNLRGQSTQTQSVLGNSVDYSYSQNASTGASTTQATDMGDGSGVGSNPTAAGIAALQYVATGATSTTQLNGTAQVTQSTNAVGDSTQYGYDSGSLMPNSVTLPTPDRPSINIQYNAANLPTVIDDPANTAGTPVKITYNAADLPAQTTDAKGLVTAYTYTLWNDIATITVGYGTPLAATTTYNYNSKKLLQNVVDPLGHTIASYTYDSLGHVLTFTDGDNITTTYQYDSLGRLIRVYDPQLTGTTNYIAYVYNDNDQVTQETTPTGNITYQYDPNTHYLTSETDLTGATTQYGYDSNTGQLNSITQVHSGGNAVTQEAYDRLGNLALVIAPNGDRTAFTSDALGRTTSSVEQGATAPSATISTQVTSASTLTVNVAASEPILVASLQYWVDGQAQASGTTQSVRLTGQTSFAFDLSGLNIGQKYDYVVTLTDRVGNETTLPQSILDMPSATVSLSSHSPHTDDILTATATVVDPNPNAQVSLTYIWQVNGVTKRQITTTALTDSFDLSVPGNGDKGDSITVTVTPSTADSLGMTAQDVATVVNTPPAPTIGGAPTIGVVGYGINLTSNPNDPDPGETFTYSWSVTKNGAPFTSGSSAGLSFTPDAPGTYVANLSVTDGSGAVGSISQSITVDSPQAPAITSANTATFTAGISGSFDVTATGLPTPTISESGALPSGVTFSNGAFGGTPLTGTGGSYPLTLTADNGIGTDATQSFTLLVDESPLITSSNTATFAVGNSGQFKVTGSGFPAPTFSESGTLPNGVTFSNGVLSGTPLAGSNGSYPLTLTAHNGIGTDATQSFTLIVDIVPVVTSNPQNSSVGNGGTAVFTASATTGTPAATVQWQISSDGGNTWTNLNNGGNYSGTTTDQLTVSGASIAMNGSLYRAVFTNPGGAATTSSAELIVQSAYAYLAYFYGYYTYIYAYDAYVMGVGSFNAYLYADYSYVYAYYAYYYNSIGDSPDSQYYAYYAYYYGYYASYYAYLDYAQSGNSYSYDAYYYGYYDWTYSNYTAAGY